MDLVNFIRPLDKLKIAESPFAKAVKSRDVALVTSTFNQRMKDSKWRDIRLRKAINYAINHKELWKYGAKGNAYNLAGFIPPGTRGHNPDLALFSYDTDRARELLAEAGYPDGFEMKVITWEAWRLEVQIIVRMLERIGMKVEFEVLTFPEFLRKIFIPILDKPPEEQDWDLEICVLTDLAGHMGATFLAIGFIEESEMRWIESDPAYENMWKEMASTVDPEAQEEKMREMVQYVYERAYRLFVYTPVMIYAVNKEVDFIPQKTGFLRLRETSVTDNHWSLRGESE